MTPTQQGLDTGDGAATQIGQRLIKHLELARALPLTQVEFQRSACLHLNVHLGLEQAADAAAVLLDTKELEACAAQQLIGIRPILGCEDADAGADDNSRAGRVG